MINRNAISLLLLSNAISGLTQGIMMIALPWYFTATLGFMSEFGVFYGFLAIISTIWSIYAGTIIDKYDRKKILLAQSIIGVGMMSLAAFSNHFNFISEWIIAGIIFVFTVLVYNIHYMNIYSFAQEMTPKENSSKVISYIEIQGQATTILGGAMAAILLEGTTNGVLSIFGLDFTIGFDIDKFNLTKLFAIDAMTYCIAVIILLNIKYVSLSPRNIEIESVWIRLQFGWNYLKSKPELILFGWFSSAVFVCVMLVSYFLMPSYVSLFLHQSTSVFASSELFFALGAVIAGFGARFFLQNVHEVIRILVLTSIGCIVFLIFSYNTHLGLFYIANILFGFSNAAIRFNRISYFWKIIPNQIMGRVSSVINLSSYILRGLWGFVFALSFFKGENGIQLVMIILMIFIFVSGIVIFSCRNQIKRLELTNLNN